MGAIGRRDLRAAGAVRLSVLAVRAVAAASWVVASGGVPSDIAALVGTLGGNAAVNAIYDCRTGLTVGATGPGLISSWADARGAGGFGPSLVQATQSKQPSVGGDGSVVFTGTGGMNLTAAANALFNIGAGSYTLICVGQIPGTQTGTAYICAIGDASSEFLGITQLGGSNALGAKGGGIIVQAESAVSSLPTINRVMCATINGTSTLGIQIPNQASVTNSIGTANASQNAPFTAGGYNGASGSGKCAIRALLMMPALITAPQIAAVMTWAAANHNADAA